MARAARHIAEAATPDNPTVAIRAGRLLDVRSGMTPLETLQAGMLRAAQLLGLTDIGRIEHVGSVMKGGGVIKK